MILGLSAYFAVIIYKYLFPEDAVIGGALSISHGHACARHNTRRLVNRDLGFDLRLLVSFVTTVSVAT